jgi:hypothetical protein
MCMLLKPIIIVGINRSGTHWVANILSNNPHVATVQYERGGGAFETNMFTNFPKSFGDLKYPDNYVGLIELWAETDFFKCAGIDKGFFYNLENRPTDYFVLFRMLMEKYAADQNKKYWLQKVNPYDGVKCIAHYPDANFIVIKRNVVDVIKSSVKGAATKYGIKKKQLVKRVFLYVFQEKILQSIKNGYIYIEYEDLKANTEKEVKRICEALSLSFAPPFFEISSSPIPALKTTRKELRL